MSVAKDEVQRLSPNHPNAKRLSNRGRINKGDGLTDGAARELGGKPTSCDILEAKRRKESILSGAPLIRWIR